MKRKRNTSNQSKSKKKKANISQNQPSTSGLPKPVFIAPAPRSTLPPPKYQSTPLSQPPPIHFAQQEHVLPQPQFAEPALHQDGPLPESQNLIDLDEVRASANEHQLENQPEETVEESVESANQNSSANLESTNQSSSANLESSNQNSSVNLESTNQNSSLNLDSTNQTSSSNDDSISTFSEADKKKIKEFRKEALHQRGQMNLIEKTKILWFLHKKQSADKKGREVFREFGRAKKKDRNQPAQLDKKSVQDYMAEYYEENYEELYTRWGRFFHKVCPIGNREYRAWEKNLLEFGCIDPNVIEKAPTLPLQIAPENTDSSTHN